MTRVLVTGGAGYIGSHTCKALHQAGLQPVTFDNLSTGHRWAVKWGPLIEGDLLSTAAIGAAMQEVQPLAIVHLAAKALVGESVRDPELYWANNVIGTHHLISAARRSGVQAVVFSSSCATYGIPHRLPIRESDPQEPINPYGATKLACEHMLRHAEAAYGIRSVILRYFNAAGADPSGDLGEDHAIETHLLPSIIEALLGHRKAVEVLGTAYPTPDGTAVRDYLHVSDIADAHVRALHHLLSGRESLVLNLGTGRGVSVRELIEAVEAVAGRPVPRITSPPRPGDPPLLVADATLADVVMGWRPQMSEPVEIVRTALAWHRSVSLACRNAAPAA